MMNKYCKRCKSFCWVLISILLIHCNTDDAHTTNNIVESTKEKIKYVDSSLKDTIVTTAVEIGQLYNSNEIKADQQFKLKLVQVNGIIKTIGRGLSNNAFVAIKGTDRFTDIFCYLSDNKDAEDLLPGKPVTIVGKCQGLWANIIFNECRILH